MSGPLIQISQAHFDELLRDSILLGDLMAVIRETFPGSPELASQDGNFAERAALLFKKLGLLRD